MRRYATYTFSATTGRVYVPSCKLCVQPRQPAVRHDADGVSVQDRLPSFMGPREILAHTAPSLRTMGERGVTFDRGTGAARP